MTENDQGRPTGNDRIAVVIMCEPGVYEWQAVLLISSLVSFNYDDIAIYAYCRDQIADQLNDRTLDFMRRHGVELRVISPQFDVNYPQGNKLFACADPRPERRTLFLDTDMMLLCPANLGDAFADGYVAGRQTSQWMWGDTPSAWDPAYRAAGIETPAKRIAHGRGKNRVHVPPSLNAGFVAYCDPDFGPVWLSTAKRIEADRKVRDIYPTLDQISLPIAAQVHGLQLRFLEECWNAGREKIPESFDRIKVFHYGNLDRLREADCSHVASLMVKDHAGFDDLDALIAFYESQGKNPSIVKHSPGFVRPAKQKRRRAWFGR